MITLPRLRGWPTAVIFSFVFTVSAFLVVRNLVLVSIPTLPKTSLSANNSVAVHPPPPNTVYGSHNFRQLKRLISEYDDDVAARLATLVKRRSTAADPDLIRLIVDMLDPPSTHMVKMSRQLFDTPQSREVDQIFKQKVNIHYTVKFVCHSVIM